MIGLKIAAIGLLVLLVTNSLIKGDRDNMPPLWIAGALMFFWVCSIVALVTGLSIAIWMWPGWQ